ncbi:phage antirepressor KilAC domain-containing protein [Cupriavidus sp. KB_39]|uniref:phage antirepressor KilAC domain-containing protein n=1 Tax=Cupriavidus sp. KB_39 TaxID=3233036 RepID=UPI003F8E9071
MNAVLQPAGSLMPMSQDGAAVTMSSREIAELVNSRHDKVKQSIERLASRGVITLPPMGEVSNDGPGPKTLAEYRVSKRDSYVIVAQLSPEFTARLVDRWQELEERAAAPQFAIPQSLPEALRLAADLADQNSQLAATVAEQAPKIEALDRIAVADGSLCISDAAKVLQIRPMGLFTWLDQRGWIFKHPDGGPWRAYQAKVERGLLEIKTGMSNNGKAFAQVLITPKGLTSLATLLAPMSAEAA